MQINLKNWFNISPKPQRKYQYF